MKQVECWWLDGAYHNPTLCILSDTGCCIWMGCTWKSDAILDFYTLICPREWTIGEFPPFTPPDGLHSYRARLVMDNRGDTTLSTLAINNAEFVHDRAHLGWVSHRNTHALLRRENWKAEVERQHICFWVLNILQQSSFVPHQINAVSSRLEEIAFKADCPCIVYSGRSKHHTAISLHGKMCSWK